MLKNLRIGMRLGSAFGLVLVLLIAISVMAISRVGQLNGQLGDLVGDKFPKVVLTNNIVNEINVVARAMRNSLLVKPDAVQRELDQVLEARKKVNDYLDQLEKTVRSEEGKKAFAKIVEARKAYQGDQQKFFDLQRAGQRDQVIELMNGSLGKTQGAYIDAAQGLIEHQSASMTQGGKEAGEMAVSTRNLIITLAIVSIILAIGLAWWVTRSITKPVGEAVDAATRIAKGDLTVRIDSDSKDEVGQLMNAMQSMLKAVSALVADAGMLSKAAVDGKLATRADASKHQGDYRKIVEGVNQTLDAVIGPLNVAAKYVDDISKGNIPPKITDSYNGDFNTIKNNLNQAIEAVNALVADAGMLSQAAVAGKLATRADASKHQGDFRKIVQGVDDTLDAVIGPLNVAADYVDRISKGDMPAKITDTYNGDFNTIKNNLNQAIEAISTMVNEAKGLETAAIEGRLATRADASRYQGDYRAIVQGVNNTLDAVIGPLNVAAKYVDDIAKGNTPPKITDTYNGDFNILKNNLNQAIDAINQQAQAAQGISEGNLGVQIHVRSENDLVSKSLVNVVQVLQGLQQELARLTEASKAGQLSERGKAERFKGAYAEVITGTNTMLDAILLPIGEGNRVLRLIRGGNLRESVTVECSGDHQKMKDAIN
ncbi:MAG: methyl-accepting chemotaxis sensory transducer, partial [Rhodocyclaceae bacterium]|nr:methyl-accepting chemotaxis sensory transducer [Rhodocyclaceae bacterium]